MFNTLYYRRCKGQGALWSAVACHRFSKRLVPSSQATAQIGDRFLARYHEMYLAEVKEIAWTR